MSGAKKRKHSEGEDSQQQTPKKKPRIQWRALTDFFKKDLSFEEAAGPEELFRRAQLPQGWHGGRMICLPDPFVGSDDCEVVNLYDNEFNDKYVDIMVDLDRLCSKVRGARGMTNYYSVMFRVIINSSVGSLIAPEQSGVEYYLSIKGHYPRDAGYSTHLHMRNVCIAKCRFIVTEKDSPWGQKSRLCNPFYIEVPRRIETECITLLLRSNLLSDNFLPTEFYFTSDQFPVSIDCINGFLVGPKGPDEKTDVIVLDEKIVAVSEKFKERMDEIDEIQHCIKGDHPVD